jgi:hypothetical protein
MQRKEELVQVANRFAIVGLGFLALAMTCAIILVTDVLFGALMTAVTGALAATMFVVLWFLLPARWSRRVSE